MSRKKPLGGSDSKPSKYLTQLESFNRECDAIRRDQDSPVDITLEEYLQERLQLSMDGLYEDIGLDPTVDTIQNIINLPDPAMRWLLPEIYLDAIRLGLRKNPIYPSVIAGEQSVKQTSVTMPAINMSDAKPKYVGVAETIALGDVSFDQKSVKISKIGRGIRVPDEVLQYVALNVVGIFMQDWGVKLGMAMDTLLINTLINGDQAGGIDSTAVIGVTTANAVVFRDLLKPWVRFSRLGKNPSVMIGGETISIDILDMLTTTRYYGDQRATVSLKLKTPLPTNASIFVHGAMPDTQVIMLDPSDTIIKLNAQPLLVESDRIISNQTQETYMSLTTGFATVMKDSRLILDESILFSGNGFPTYFDPTNAEKVVID